MSVVGSAPAVGSSHSHPSHRSSETSHLITIHRCRWAWCRQIFDTNAQLVYHVVHEHVKKSVPVRLREISLLRRLEGEESMDTSDQLSGGTSSGAVNSMNVHGFHDSQAASGSHVQPLELAGGQSNQNTGLQTPPAATMTTAGGPSPSRDESGPQPPSFASLASPPRSIRAQSIPPSPGFGLQVLGNVGGGLARDSDSGSLPSRITDDESCHEAQHQDQESLIARDGATEAATRSLSQQIDRSSSQQPSSTGIETDFRYALGSVQKDADFPVSNARALSEENICASPGSLPSNQSYTDNYKRSRPRPLPQSWTMELKTQRPVPSQSPTQTQLQSQVHGALASAHPPRQTWYQSPHSPRKHTANGSGDSEVPPLQRRRT